MTTGQSDVLARDDAHGSEVVRKPCSRGEAVGVDVWRAEDQAANGPGAPLENARREGVADRVRIATADARALPFADASFDAVLSHWVVHNLPEAAGRALVLDEMLRVLRLLPDWHLPGGALSFVTPSSQAQPAKVEAVAEFFAARLSRRVVDRD